MKASIVAQVFISLGALLGADASRGDQVAGANFSRLRQTTQYREAVIAGAEKSGAWVVAKCTGGKTSLSDRLSVAKGPVMVDAQLRPQTGNWIEHIELEGCGGARQLNVMVMVPRPGTIAIIPMLPGTTHADSVLQRDGAVFAFAAAKIDQNGCKPIFVADTAYVGPLSEAPLVIGKPGWSEFWTVGQCDRRTMIEMRFVPDSKGTAIVAHLQPSP